ncbi:hypothetical protein P59_172 [Bacillus phage P59]|nr:hypothetical protein P59_172 [Bacillus phage P59]
MKRKTIGKMSKTRGTWGSIKPTTRVKQSDKAYNRKKKHKSREEY